MIKQWVKDIPNWEKEYLKKMRSKLTDRQIELLDGSEIKSHEGMIFGQMYNHWKSIKENESLEQI